jgi:hypothetical protein
VTTRLAIDELRSARARREVYPGEWLPEPLVEDDAARHAEMSDSLSLTLLHLLAAVPVPLVGAERVAKAIIGWGRQARERGIVHRRTLVNGEPGLVFYEPDGRALWVAALEIADGFVVAIRSVLNPDKLTHLAPR